ncbi:MAG: septum formation protein Maf [Clostridia bacterium]|nr:septum formation protein Maf [Clostridia bacterium]
MRIILASASPRRKSLLESAGVKAEIIPSNADESDADENIALKSAEPDAALALSRARLKAFDVARSLSKQSKANPFVVCPQKQNQNGRGGFIVIGADTVVYKDGRFYGKPSDAADARRMLSELSDATHSVVTGVCIVDSDFDMRLFYERTLLTFSEIDPCAAEAYVNCGKSFGKAGAYGAQDKEIQTYIKCLDGELDNVIGLPVKKLLKHIEENSKWRQWK